MRTQIIILVSSLLGADVFAGTTEPPVPPARSAKAKSKRTAKPAAPATIHPEAPPVPKEELCQVKVQIDNLRKNGEAYQGQLCYTVFKGKDGFPDKPDLAITNQCVKVEQSPTMSFMLKDLKCNQDYAIAVLHDENMNRQLDKNIAIPKEGVGMSNNPSFIRVNAPPYDNCKFMTQSPTSQQEIRIHYWP